MRHDQLITMHDLENKVTVQQTKYKEDVFMKLCQGREKRKYTASSIRIWMETDFFF